jgi:hypothetical protein
LIEQAHRVLFNINVDTWARSAARGVSQLLTGFLLLIRNPSRRWLGEEFGT